MYSLVSGATLALPNHFPQTFNSIGIRTRNLNNNELLGITITRPNNNELVFGPAYFDKKESKDNEDIYVLYKFESKITYYPKGAFEALNSLYKDTHKGRKDYLRTK